MQQKFLWVIPVVLIGAGILLYSVLQSNPDKTKTDEPAYTGAYTGESYLFVTETDQFSITYTEPSEQARLVYAGMTYDLKQTISASGARYESADGKVIFWEHQGEATLEIDGKTVVEGAVPAQNISESDVTSAVSQPLSYTTWLWKETSYNNNDNETVKPLQTESFVLTFLDDQNFSATTDCNSLTGRYAVSAETNEISFSSIASTRMICPDESQEKIFIKMLEETEGFAINIIMAGEEELVLTTKNNSSRIIFYSSTNTIPAEPETGGVETTENDLIEYEKIIGMTEDQAEIYAEKTTIPFRVIRRDGEDLPATMDYRPGRINATIEKGLVTEYFIE